MQVDFQDLLTEDALGGEASGQLCDARLERRHAKVLRQLSKAPSKSFPGAFTDSAELEGFYRLIGNENASWRGLLRGHIGATAARCGDFGSALVVHDTTWVSLPVHDPELLRKHLARPTTKTQGFMAHVSLAVTAAGRPVPLGALAVQPFVRRKHLPDEEAEAFWEAEGGLFGSERQRWFDAVERTEAELPSGTRAIHVMDREGDSFPMVAWLMMTRRGFVVRVSTTDRRVKVDKAVGKLDELLADVPFMGEVQARLSSRSPLRPAHSKRSMPDRKSRQAQLSVRAATVVLSPTTASAKPYVPDGFELPREQQVNLVEVIERAPPAGQAPVRWLLFTSEPVESLADLMAVVTTYRRRWLIEEYFKALKSGCKLQERQMASATGMLKVLAVLAPVAWHMLLLRALHRAEKPSHWSQVMPELTFEILRRAVPKAKLSRRATTDEIMMAIAGLAGHIKNNGAPGWQKLHEGWEVLRQLEVGYRIRESMTRPMETA